MIQVHNSKENTKKMVKLEAPRDGIRLRIAGKITGSAFLKPKKLDQGKQKRKKKHPHK